ncbi:MAG TPA: NAD(P)/FAD-dependent oxidoreductase [Actinomycetes bacterium]|jgi:monoamine oxidase|nr:NAD(P)/FAD-dependent oxidoreductase [Actinomycetes bacterium]
MRVCVIGAGFAGLAAAWTLQEGGAEPLVLEARDRVGGRVHSARLGNAAIVELGAEFVERGHRALADTTGRLGLELAPAGMSYGDREPRGGLGVDRETLWAEVAKLGRLLAEPGRAWRRPGLSVAAVLEALPLDPGAREAIAARIQVSAAQPVGALAATSLDHAGSTFDRSESVRVAGGNQRVADRLAERLGPAVRLGAPAESVVWTGPGVRVRAGGDVVTADAAVVAVPASVTGRIRFDPALPAWKAGALGRVVYGHAAKLFVPLRRPAPPSAVLSVPDHYWTWTARGADGAVQPVVSAFAGSAPALERLGVAEGPGGWLGRLRALRPDLDLDEAGVVLSTWDCDPWVGAAYSTRTPDRDPGDDELLARPAGRLHFAGEHTAGDWAGLMEGAVRSGLRAAAEVLGRLPG